MRAVHEKDLADGWGRLPLPDETGKLLGLIFAYRPGGQNLNAAIPINYSAQTFKQKSHLARPPT